MRFNPDGRCVPERPARDKARELRREAAMPERKLWNLLRGDRFRVEGVVVKFRRQHPIGPYVADFYCAELGLVVELDGQQHRPGRDATRDAAMLVLGLRVLRYSVAQFERFEDATLRDIARAVRAQRGLKNGGDKE